MNSLRFNGSAWPETCSADTVVPLMTNMSTPASTTVLKYSLVRCGDSEPATVTPASRISFRRAATLPGDELVPSPSWVTDFAIDIDAAPAEVWPWLVQLGYGRAGWYTWYPLDNGGVASADRIVPALQQLAVGDLIPDGPRASVGFGVWRVHELVPERALVLWSRRDPLDGRERGDGGGIAISWAFVLTELEGGERLRVGGDRRTHVDARGAHGRHNPDITVPPSLE